MITPIKNEEYTLYTAGIAADLVTAVIEPVAESDLIIDASESSTVEELATNNDASESSNTNAVDALLDDLLVVDDHSEQLLIIDSGLTPEQQQSLIKVAEEAGHDYIILDNSDTIETLIQDLSQFENLDAIHLYSHGQSDSFDLAGEKISGSNLNSYSELFEAIKDSINETGDLLIYGCDVGEDSESSFAEDIANLTSADVKLSDDITGPEDLGGDWDLEVEIGEVETDELVIDDFNQVLATVNTSEFPFFTHNNKDLLEQVGTTYRLYDNTNFTNLVGSGIRNNGSDIGPIRVRDDGHDSESHEGFIYLPTSGVYRFGTHYADDTTTISIDGTVVVNHTGFSAKYGSIELDAGWHYLKSTWVNTYNVGSMSVNKINPEGASERLDWNDLAVSISDVTSEEVSYLEDSSPVQIAQKLDLFSLRGESFTELRISVGDFDGSDIITYDDSLAGISIVDDGNGNISFTGSMTGSIAEDLIKSINYSSSNNNPSGSRDIAISLDSSVNTLSYTSTVNLIPVNDAPEGSNQEVTAFEDEDYIFKLTDFSEGYSDEEGDSLESIRIESLPAGTFELNGSSVSLSDTISIADIESGLLTYRAPENDSGNDFTSFNFSVGDGSDFSESENTMTINVDAVNDAPILRSGSPADTNTPGPNETTNEDTPLILTTSAYAYDVEGDLLTVVTSSAEEGTVVDNGDGTFTFTPKEDFNGTTSIDVTIQDPSGEEVDLTIPIEVLPVNDRPVGINDYIASRDNTVTYDVVENDTDIENDTLFVLDIVSVDNGATAEIVDGKIKVTSPEGFNKSVQVVYTVSDGDLTSTATLEIEFQPDVILPEEEEEEAFAKGLSKISNSKGLAVNIAQMSDGEYNSNDQNSLAESNEFQPDINDGVNVVPTLPESEFADDMLKDISSELSTEVDQLLESI